MRIAMLAPLYENVPPTRYGGTERVVYYLTEELVRRGHEVTLFASGTSRTSARLVAVCPQPLILEERSSDPVAYHVLELGLAFQRAAEFDLVHSHCDFRAFPFGRLTSVPIVSTNHNRLDAPENQRFVELYPEAAITTLSHSQRRLLPRARCLGVCYNGVPVRDFPFRSTPGDYLAFVGRMSPEKGPLEAIEVARRAGVPLKIVAKVNSWERDYFETKVRPRLRPPLIEYVGELDELNKRDFLSDALALLFPIHWPEPFGMVMIEAMATGTPVLAFPVGAATEVIDVGLTGFLCDDVASMARRVPDAAALNRWSCRGRVAQRFSDRTMTNAYEAAYRRLLAAATGPSRRRIARAG